MRKLKDLLYAAGGRVSRDDVVWCYRTLLGRDPESETVVREHMRCADFRRLVMAFTGSEEFRHLRRHRSFTTLAAPEGRIDVEIEPEHVGPMLARMKATWTHLGVLRPHHSVLTGEAFLPDNLPGSIDHFWASGVEEAQTVLGLMAAHGKEAAGHTCVEYGCGVGRVTGPLAQHFAAVHAYDISMAHLEHARLRVEALGLDNVHWVPCSEAVVEELVPCDVFYSRLVFQHNPPPLMHALVRACLRSLKPDGLGIFQLPTRIDGYSHSNEAWLAAPPPLDMEMHCLPQRYVFRAIEEAGCLLLAVHDEDSAGNDRFTSNTFIVRRPAIARPRSDRA